MVAGGDGDGFSIGGNHFLHACRRNVDLTYIVMDNHVYGMTKGQASPTTESDWTGAKLTPEGPGVASFQPLEIALSAGANFIGTNGGEYGIRGFVRAYDAETGKQAVTATAAGEIGQQPYVRLGVRQTQPQLITVSREGQLQGFGRRFEPPPQLLPVPLIGAPALPQQSPDMLTLRKAVATLTDPIDRHDWMANSLARSQGAIGARLGEGLAFLATVGSTAPFIGLFGTVIGIYRALIKIGASGQASIDVVAGPAPDAAR